MKTNSSSVRISPDEQGNAIRVSKNNPEYGHIRLTQEKTSFGTNGWVNRKVLSTLVHGTVEDLQSLGYEGGQELPGILNVQEQLSPFNENDPDRDLKIAGDTGIVCKGVDNNTGEELPIYRKVFYDPSGQSTDSIIRHINGDEIREANGGAAPKKSKTINQNELNELLEKKSDKKAKKEEVVEEVKEEEVVMENEAFDL